MNFTSTGNTEVKKGSSSAVDDADAIFLLAPEAERLIEALQPFPLDKVGTEEWLLQHEVIEKLNMQAHQCARSGSEDFILEAMVTYDKLPVIIHELVVIEAWRENVYPLIQMDLAKAGGMRGYFALYHEATLANLLEVALYHDYALEAIGEPLIELLDWAVRRLVYLNALPPDHSELWAPQALTAGKDLQEGLKKIRDRTPEEDQKRQYREVQFKVGVSAVVISRYLCEHASKISLSVFSRLIDTHDLLMLLVPLLDNPPWTRRTDRGKWQKYDDQKWSDVAPANLMKLTKLEGQLWLALYNLLCDKEFRQRYYFNTHRKDSLLRVRKYINDVLVDQLPMLADVQRYMDELTIMKPPEPSQQSEVNGTMCRFLRAVERSARLKKHYRDASREGHP